MSAKRSWGIWLRASLLCGVFVAAPVLGRAADVLLVERPAGLVVYNAYQQQATEAERRLLPPFVPLRVLDFHAVMSDGFTVCMKVEAHGAVFFLLTEDGALAGSGHGATRLLRSVIMLGDTILVRPGHALAGESPLGKAGARYGGGESLMRYFRAGEKTYVRRLESASAFGWVVLDEGGRGRIWDRARQAAAVVEEAGIPDRLATGVQEVLQDANNTLAAIYAELSRESGRRLSPPSWQMRVAPDQLACVLNGAPPGTFQQSTEQLGRSLENLVLGSGFAVEVREGRIAIVRKR